MNTIINELHATRVLLETLLVAQLLNIFPAFYGLRKFITMFTRACRLLSLTQSTPNSIFI
jgi:hypothetical protein